MDVGNQRRQGESIRSEADLLDILDFQGKAQEPVLLHADEDWLDLLRRLQALLIERLAKRRICIEANPTSNLIIGGYADYT